MAKARGSVRKYEARTSESLPLTDVLAQVQQDVNGLERLQALQTRLLVETREHLTRLISRITEQEPS